VRLLPLLRLPFRLRLLKAELPILILLIANRFFTTQRAILLLTGQLLENVLLLRELLLAAIIRAERIEAAHQLPENALSCH
jgi:hypothetical protein